jgi:hypothetical protein
MPVKAKDSHTRIKPFKIKNAGHLRFCPGSTANSNALELYDSLLKEGLVEYRDSENAKADCADFCVVKTSRHFSCARRCLAPCGAAQPCLGHQYSSEIRCMLFIMPSYRGLN